MTLQLCTVTHQRVLVRVIMTSCPFVRSTDRVFVVYIRIWSDALWDQREGMPLWLEKVSHCFRRLCRSELLIKLGPKKEVLLYFVSSGPRKRFLDFTIKLETLLKEIFNKNNHKRMSYCDNFFHCILLINKNNLFIVTCNVVIFKPLTVPLGLRREMWLNFAVSQRRKDTWAHVQSDIRHWLSWGQSKSHRLSAHL